MHATRFVSAAALVLLLAAPAASAVSLSPRGVGQVLIYPYYTVNKSQDTLLSVVNASAVSKAVQVRVLEGYNGRDTLAFVLYLSPHDVWTASISQTADNGGALVKTSDTSCTSTPFPANGQPLSSAGYDGTGVVPADGGPTSITRTREGFIEFIVGADITPGSPTDVATTHVQNGLPGGGVPPGCASLNDATTQQDEVAPSGGLFGSASIVNVGEGTFFPYNADALQGFTDLPLINPATAELGVTLADANSADAYWAGGAKAYVTNNEGAPITLDYPTGIDAVSAVFMVDAIYNEYVVAASLGANTDWVITFPTKNFYVDPIFGAVPFAPFSEPFAAPGESNVVVSGTVYDREEEGQTFGGPCDLCPPPGNPPSLSYQVNVVGFPTQPPSSPTGVFGSNLGSLVFNHFGDDGNVELDFANYAMPGGVAIDSAIGAPVTLNGLPATGFMAYNVINTNAQPGLLANYSGVFRHRTTMACSGNVDGCDPIISGGSTP